MPARPADPLAVLRRLDVEATRRGHVSPDFPDALAAVERLVEAARGVAANDGVAAATRWGGKPSLDESLAPFDGGESMTPRPVDADLATLRDRLNKIVSDSLDVPVVYRDGRSALDVQTHDMGQVSGWFADVRETLKRVEAELARLTQERDDARAEAAEAECARLRQALERVLDCRGPFNGTVSERGGEPAICTKCEAEAREALARLDGAR